MAQQWWETVLACTDPTDTAAVHLASNALEEGLGQVVGDPSMVQAMLERPWLCTRAALCDTPGGRAFVAQLREQLTCLPVPTSLTAVDGTEVCGPADLRTTLGVLARVSHDDYFAVFEFCQRAYSNFLDRALSSGTATLQSLVFSAAQLPMDPCLQVLLDALQRTPEFTSRTFKGRCQILGALYSDALAQLDFPCEEGWTCGGGVPSSVGALRALEAPEPWFEIVCVTPSTVEAWYNNVLVPVWEGLRGLDVRDGLCVDEWRFENILDTCIELTGMLHFSLGAVSDPAERHKQREQRERLATTCFDMCLFRAQHQDCLDESLSFQIPKWMLHFAPEQVAAMVVANVEHVTAPLLRALLNIEGHSCTVAFVIAGNLHCLSWDLVRTLQAMHRVLRALPMSLVDEAGARSLL